MIIRELDPGQNVTERDVNDATSESDSDADGSRNSQVLHGETEIQEKTRGIFSDLERHDLQTR